MAAITLATISFSQPPLKLGGFAPPLDPPRNPFVLVQGFDANVRVVESCQFNTFLMEKSRG